MALTKKKIPKAGQINIIRNRNEAPSPIDGPSRLKNLGKIKLGKMKVKAKNIIDIK